MDLIKKPDIEEVDDGSDKKPDIQEVDDGSDKKPDIEEVDDRSKKNRIMSQMSLRKCPWRNVPGCWSSGKMSF